MNIIFITPTPPTMSDIDATATKKYFIISVILFTADSADAILRTEKSSPSSSAISCLDRKTVRTSPFVCSTFISSSVFKRMKFK